MFNKILSGIASLVIALAGSLLPINPEPNFKALPSQNLGVTITKGTADFSDNLAAPLTASGTTFTLVRGTNTFTSTALSGSYIFRIDNEYIEASCTSTACTVTTRGLSDEDLKTHVNAQTKSHQRFAAVKVTDAYILRTSRILNGDETLENKISYTSHPTFSANTEIVDKQYVDNVALSGAPDGNNSTKGIYEEGLITEIAAGTAAGSTTAHLVPTSTQFSASYTGTQKIPVTQGNGVLAPGFLPTASSITWTATTTFSVTSILNGAIKTNGSAGAVGQVLISGGGGFPAYWGSTSGTSAFIAQTAIGTTVTSTRGYTGNTTGFVGKVVFPANIANLNHVYFWMSTPPIVGTFKVGLYSEDGKRLITSGTSSSTPVAAGVVTTTLTTVNVPSGMYYLMIVPVSTVSASFDTWGTNATPWSKLGSLAGSTINQVFEGQLTVDADTLPSSFSTVTSITAGQTNTLIGRFDTN